MAAKSQPSFSPGRRWKIGFDVVLRTALVLAVAVMVNYLGANFFRRFYLSSQAQQLSTRTLSVVRTITNRVNVTLYFDTQDEENFYPTISALLKEYQSANPNIMVKTVDYVRAGDAGAAQKIKEQYKLGSATDKDLVIFDCGGHFRIAPGAALYQKKIEQIPNENPNEKELSFRKKPIAFNGEMMFTAMLLALEKPTPFKAYFLQGDGEPLLSDARDPGYLKFGAVLAENYITNEPLQLLGSDAVPDDCNLLIIAGPRTAFSPGELQKIDQYLAQGGRMFMLFNYPSVRTGLEPILARWGVNVVADVVQEPKNTSSGQDIIIYNFSSHPAVNPLTGLALQLILPRPVGIVDLQNPPADAPKVDALVSSSPQSTLMHNPAAAPRSYPLMVAIEQKTVPGVANPRGTTRIIVAGDSSFLNNRQIESLANRDFAGYAVNWLLDRTVLLEGIGPRPVTEFRLTMSRDQQQTVRWLLLGALPGGVLIFGWLVWLARRR